MVPAVCPYCNIKKLGCQALTLPIVSIRVYLQMVENLLDSLCWERSSKPSGREFSADKQNWRSWIQAAGPERTPTTTHRTGLAGYLCPVKQPLPHLLIPGPTVSYMIWKVRSHLDCWLWDLITSTLLLTSKMDALDLCLRTHLGPLHLCCMKTKPCMQLKKQERKTWALQWRPRMWSLFSRLSHMPGHLIEGWNEVEWTNQPRKHTEKKPLPSTFISFKKGKQIFQNHLKHKGHNLTLKHRWQL